MGWPRAKRAQWREHLLDRLRRQAATTSDPALFALLEELRALPSPDVSAGEGIEGARPELLGSELFVPELFVPELFVPFRIRTDQGVLSFISITTVFGMPMDVTLQELAIESFLPADAFTRDAIDQRMPASR